MFDWPTFVFSLPLLAQALLITLQTSLLGNVIGFAIAVGIASMQLAGRPLLRRLGGSYIFVFRGVPLLVQLLVIYYLAPMLGAPNLSPMVAAIMALSLCSGAYIAEILRGGLMAIPPGQREAAHLLGMSRAAILLRIELPQAVQSTLPSLVNELVLLIKASALVSVVGLADLTRVAQNLAASDYLFFQHYLVLAGIYCLINIPLTMFGRGLERHLQRSLA
ncbi:MULTISPECIES: amino acid ABC transporter permease [Halomonadaceae]|uniref:amino acid ABC transporter permease n=1 Tax=Halomonadaceae TaxID=28256 RepID=UPI0015986C90|nr:MULTISPECIES: amino acid ABC transporter permease [Halomonas]QJQ93865.1 amino acid ABC transporter permease [Halomonas sp. PA5]